MIEPVNRPAPPGRPSEAEVHCRLGIQLKKTGKLKEAMDHFQRALARDPGSLDACIQMGDLLFEIGRSGDALGMYGRAAQINPRNAIAWRALAKTYCRLGRFDEAESSCRQALALDPSAHDTYVVLANALQRRHRFDGARASLQSALRLKPDLAEAHFALGNLYRMMGDADLARSSYQQVLKFDSHHMSARLELAALHREANQDEAVDAELEWLIRDSRNRAMVYALFGDCLRDRGLLSAAEASYRRAIALAPDRAEPRSALGAVLHLQCRLREALESYDQALRLRADNPEAHFGRATSLLLAGDLEAGWREYEWLWRCGGNQRPFVQQPEWDGGDLSGKTILVQDDQGIGDQIMFASCLPDLLVKADRVVVQVDRRFQRLFERSFPPCIVNPAMRQGQDANVRADVHIWMSGLPRIFRPSLGHFPAHTGYLVPDAVAVRKWRARYAELGGGFTVGISWRGGAVGLAQSQRSIPLTRWAPILGVPGVRFVNLQYGECGEELAEAGRRCGVRIHDWEDADPLMDLDDFCAQIKALDLVISIDNSTVHMAGATGTPVWTLLPFAPDWRWLLEREDSPWYPAMRLFRQPVLGDWGSVMGRVAGKLARLVGPPSRPGNGPAF